MKIAVFSTKTYDRNFFLKINQERHQLTFLEPRLSSKTAALAEEQDAVCVFVNDDLNVDVLTTLQKQGIRLILLRCAGFNNVDLAAANKLGIRVARVPAYSPHAVAEHTLALILGLNRKTHRAYNRVREGNFALDGLMGFDLVGKTVGVIGAGQIGEIFARIMKALGCEVLIHDPYLQETADKDFSLVELAELYQRADIISLHCPLTPQTHHLINEQAIGQMKDGVMLINTSRGKIVHTRAVIDALKTGRVGSLGLDVYEEEGDLFFADLSAEVIQDDVFMRLLTFPNVLITGHQAFFTTEAMTQIVQTTLDNASAFESQQGSFHEVTWQQVQGDS
ncbi:hydroxyacid dehydrogenase [Aliidiomarina minuta]|uniref:Hydroxyacid dehydrogenase n=1 Tax=Aliidiomarina minuta TaxID=880057 RepID=A0A432W5K7_9GAMM|nr:2-hydroxyacid dehydrogenase [Aliidiomarina minuta]RUO25321.1 hydroxyacid dehydrogenase [Aliidiomarina minuta]